MSKIFLVSRGIYSDYSVKGVYSTRERADRAAELYTNRWDEAEVEEFELDAIPSHQSSLLPFYVVMDKEGNCTDKPERTDVEDQGYDHVWGGTDYRFFVWAKDIPHAIKIANERRIQLLAQNNGEWEPAPIIPQTQLDVNTERERRASGGDEIPF